MDPFTYLGWDWQDPYLDPTLNILPDSGWDPHSIQFDLKLQSVFFSLLLIEIVENVEKYLSYFYFVLYPCFLFLSSMAIDFIVIVYPSPEIRIRPYGNTWSRSNKAPGSGSAVLHELLHLCQINLGRRLSFSAEKAKMWLFNTFWCMFTDIFSLNLGLQNFNDPGKRVTFLHRKFLFFDLWMKWMINTIFTYVEWIFCVICWCYINTNNENSSN